MVLVGELVAGAGLGILFTALYDRVKKLISMSMQFKPLLRDLESTLDSLQPVIEQIGDHNTELNISNKEIEILKTQMKEGVELVCNLSKVRNKWRNYKGHPVIQQVHELDTALKRVLEILKVHGLRDGKEMLALVRKHTHQLVGLTSDGKETLVLVKDIAREWKEFKEVIMEVPLFNRNDMVGNQIRIKECSSLPVGMNEALSDRNSVVHDEIKIKPSPLVGLDVPLKELKKKLLKDGVSLLVLTGPAGCGKTTLAKQFSQEEQIIDSRAM